MLLNAKQ